MKRYFVIYPFLLYIFGYSCYASYRIFASKLAIFKIIFVPCRFNSRDNRNAHMFIHSDRKPYECTVCGAGFMRKPMILQHLNTHSGLPASPEMCIKVFYCTVKPLFINRETIGIIDTHHHSPTLLKGNCR